MIRYLNVIFHTLTRSADGRRRVSQWMPRGFGYGLTSNCLTQITDDSPSPCRTRSIRLMPVSEFRSAMSRTAFPCPQFRPMFQNRPADIRYAPGSAAQTSRSWQKTHTIKQKIISKLSYQKVIWSISVSKRPQITCLIRFLEIHLTFFLLQVIIWTSSSSKCEVILICSILQSPNTTKKFPLRPR